MATPYERLIKPAVQSASHNERPLPHPSKTAAKKMMRKPVRIEKPQLPFSVRPRFRFDLQPPPMDPKMLLGTLSASSYVKPHFSDLERHYRPTAIPSDPTYGLRANLVDTPLYKTAAELNPDDVQLLDLVMRGRSSGDQLSSHRASGDKRRTSGILSPPRKPEPTNASWMRRMAYDEYDTSTHKNMDAIEIANKMRERNDRKQALSEKSRREKLLKSFKPPSRNIKHPGRKVQNIRPVNAAPIFPDILLLARDLIAIEVDNQDVLTVTKRCKKDPEAAEQSLQTTATVSVAERTAYESRKKFVACYTPTMETIRKRRRTKEQNEEEEEEEAPKSKKIYLGEEEDYQWTGEYVIREGKFEDSRISGTPARSCIGITEHFVEGGNGKVVTASRIGTTWKFSRIPHTNNVRLGKDGLKIIREDQEEREDEMLESILSGNGMKKNRARVEPKKGRV